MKEKQVRFLGQADALEKKMATYYCILAWEIPWTKDPCGLQPTKSQSQIRLRD